MYRIKNIRKIFNVVSRIFPLLFLQYYVQSSQNCHMKVFYKLYSKTPKSAPPQSADPASLRLVLWSTTPHSAVNLRIFSSIHIAYFASKLNKSTKYTFESCFKVKENSKTYIWQVFTIMNCFKKLQKWNKSAKHTFERHLSVMNCFRKLQNIHITSFFTCLKSKQIHKTYIWQVFYDERKTFEDFHKLSVEKEILKIGQDLTELDVNATLEILENLINLMNFAFEWM